MNKQLMISITTSEPRNPFSEIKVDVFERETENVEVHRVMGFYPEHIEPDFSFTLDDRIYKRVKNYLKDPVLESEQEEDGYIVDSGIKVCDGEQTEIDLFLEGGKRHFSYSNLNAYKDHLDEYPQTKKIYKIQTCIMREVRRQFRAEKERFEK